MEMTLNMTAFEHMAFDEMLCVDGGAWNARHWAACGLIVLGTACGIAGIWCPTLWGGTVKSWSTASVLLLGTGGILAIG